MQVAKRLNKKERNYYQALTERVRTDEFLRKKNLVRKNQGVDETKSLNNQLTLRNVLSSVLLRDFFALLVGVFGA